jgi:hypothetical protein
VVLFVNLALLCAAQWAGAPFDAARGSLVLLAVLVFETALLFWLRRKRSTSAKQRLFGTFTITTAFVLPLYAALALSGLLNLLLAADDNDVLALVALTLAVLVGSIATRERREAGAWPALGLFALGVIQSYNALSAEPRWLGGTLVLTMLGFSMLISLIEQLPPPIIARSYLKRVRVVWFRPSTLGTGVLAGLGLLHATAFSWENGAVGPLIFALVSAAPLLALLALRRGTLAFAYAAVAAIVAAGLLQLADMGVRGPQWYVIPIGLYLLGLAQGLRRFEGRTRLAQTLEASALAIALGTTAIQAVSNEVTYLSYSLWLCVEALIVVGVGLLLRLRVPFVGGIAFFIAGATWMTLNSVQLDNQWLVFGAVGLLMIAAYVVLERHQEWLLRSGRNLLAELRSWG